MLQAIANILVSVANAINSKNVTKFTTSQLNYVENVLRHDLQRWNAVVRETQPDGSILANVVEVVSITSLCETFATSLHKVNATLDAAKFEASCRS